MKLYDTYTKKIREFKPLNDNEVKFYSCGPTVYSSTHIGHLSTYVRTDLLKQYLKNWKNYKVKHVMNITDFGHMTSDEDYGIDKMKKAMDKEHKTAKEIAEYYTQEFHDVLKKMKIAPADIECKATENVPEMIKFIEKIIERKYAYVKDGNVYFDTAKFEDYGKLSGKRIDEQESEARLKEDSNKKSPFDFLLWAKHKEEHSHVWNSPWGKGMPGWHIECSAMSRKYLGGDFDIHSGGIDHYFPHHENEIAQNYGALGKVGVNYWVHFGLLTINGEKMSKSKGNYITAPDILKLHSPETLRMWIFSSHYSSEFDYFEKNITHAQERVDKINNFIQHLLEIREGGSWEEKESTCKFIKKYYDKFENAMNNNLNTPEALAVIFEMMTDVNKMELTAEDAGHILAFLEKIDSVFKIMDFEIEKTDVPIEVNELISERETARQNKDWKTADKLRNEIQKRGFQISDTDEGQKIKKV